MLTEVQFNGNGSHLRGDENNIQTCEASKDYILVKQNVTKRQANNILGTGRASYSFLIKTKHFSRFFQVELLFLRTANIYFHQILQKNTVQTFVVDSN